MKMQDVGYKVGAPQKGGAPTDIPGRHRIDRPSVYMEDKHMDLDNLEQGKTYHVEGLAKVVSKTERSVGGKKDSNLQLEFYKMAFEPMTKKKSEDMQDQEDEGKLKKLLEKS